MSNSIPPPPPPNSGFPPAPPVPGFIPSGQMPSYALVAAPAPTGLRKAAVILMWVAVGATLLAAFAALNRKSVWDDFLKGAKTFDDLDDADSFLGSAMLLYFAVALATAIVLAIWSNRVATNAKAHGAAVSPGLAAGGWFIPIAWYFIPFMQLRKAAGGRGDTTSLGWWQGLFAIGMIGGGVALQMFDDDAARDDVSGDLRNQSVGLFIAAALFAGAALFAARAMRSVENATSVA